MQRFEAAVAGVVLAVLAIGLALALLLPPAFTRTMSARFSELSGTRAAALAEAAREFVVSGDSGARLVLDNSMTAEAVAHLDDVRRVIAAAKAATVLLAAVFTAWAILAIRRGRLDAVAAALWVGAGLAAGLVVLIGLFAAIDFDAFFSGFHGLFFTPGTWVFPSDSVLIRLFPEPFWVGAGVVWGVLICLLAAVYAVFGWAIGARLRGNDAEPRARGEAQNA